MTTPQSPARVEIDHALPELPKKRRRFLCTKCTSVACTEGTENDEHPLCAVCGYLGFSGDVPLTDDQIRAYATEARAAERAEVVRLREALKVLVDRDFTFFSGQMIGASKPISREEILAARAALATTTQGEQK